MLVRSDVLRARGGFPELVGDCTDAKRLHQFLDTAGDLDLSLLRDDRPYHHRFNTIADNPSFEGAHADFVLPEAHHTYGDSHISTYSIAGPCPTITTTPPIIFDSRPGANVFRRLSTHEVMRIQGLSDSFSFPTTFTDHDTYAAVGKDMDIYCLRVLGRTIDGYLRRTTAPLAPLVCGYTAAEQAVRIRCNLGHPSNEVTRWMGYPTLKGPCAICDAHKS